MRFYCLLYFVSVLSYKWEIALHIFMLLVKNNVIIKIWIICISSPLVLYIISTSSVLHISFHHHSFALLFQKWVGRQAIIVINPLHCFLFCSKNLVAAATDRRHKTKDLKMLTRYSKTKSWDSKILTRDSQIKTRY